MLNRAIVGRAVGRLSLVIAFTAVLQTGCGGSSSEVPVTSQSAATAGAAPPRATPAPPFTSIDSASATDVLRYASTLEFTDDHAFADTLTIVEGSRQALLRFSPEIGSRTTTINDLKQGRIAARWLRFGDSVRYPIRSMVGYVWMDSISTGWRVLYVSSDSALGRTYGQAFLSNDSNLRDGYPTPKAPVMTDSLHSVSCYYTDTRWVCPRFGGLTQATVDSLYQRR